MAIVLTFLAGLAAGGDCVIKDDIWNGGSMQMHMTDASFSDIPMIRRAPRRERKTAQLPPPQPFGAPVLIMDAVTPLGGETVLSLLLKRMARGPKDPPA